MCKITDKLRSKSILITGASGLICSAFVDLLMHYNALEKTNITVYAASRNLKKAQKRFHVYWDNPLFFFIQHDVVDAFLLEAPIDYIVHGASNASPERFVADPVGTMKANLWGVSNLLDLAKEKQSRLLYISSGEIYGEGDGRDFREDYCGYINCLNPRSCYPSSKRASETLCIAYKKQYGVDVVIARPGHIYGFDIEEDNRAFAQFLRMAKSGNNILLKSAGIQVRSYCYVDDCASALLYILLKGISGEAYNIANSESVLSIKDLAELIANIARVNVINTFASDKESEGYSKVQRAVLNCEKIHTLGWTASVDLKSGIKRILEIRKEIFC